MIGNIPYPNKLKVWHIPIFEPKNFSLNVITNPPTQKIVKIKTKIEVSLFVFPVDNAMLYKKQNIKGPHKSQLYNSSIFLFLFL